MTSSQNKKQNGSHLRLIRAYWVTFSILTKYFLLYLVRKIISEKRSGALMMRVHQKTTQKILKNIVKLKGLYIKVGQALSIMTNFLPPAFTQGLEQLQDAVPPHPYEDMRARFLVDFGKTPEELFKNFEKTPIASASLGQVHIAHLRNGTKLAVKFQYPNIDEIVKSDLKTIQRIFGLLDFIFPSYGIREVYVECAKMILEELDYESEGKNLEKIRENFKGDSSTIFPKIHWELSSKKILTAEFVEGTKVTDLDAFKKASIDPHDVAVSLIHFYCKQIFIDGVFHADPHPGNIIIQPARGESPPYRIAMVDYGATATISPQMKAGITLFVEGLIKRDTHILSNALKQMGFVAKENNEETLDKIVDYFYGKIKGVKIEDFRQINIGDFQNLSDILELKKMDISFRELTSTFHVPKNWILIERTIILMMGLTTRLDPHLNPADIVIPYVEKFVLGKDKNVSDLIIESTKEILTSYINLPSEISKVLRKLEAGKIIIQDKDKKKQTEKIYQGIHQLIYTLFFILATTSGYLFHKEGNLEWVLRMKYMAGIFGVLLGYSIFRNRK